EVAPRRNDALEAAHARQLELRLRELDVVLDDQHDAIALLDRVAVVVYLGLQEHLGVEDFLFLRRGILHLFGRSLRFGSSARQEQCEGRTFARARRDADLAAEQAGDLARDREPEPRAPEAPARRAVGLLERLE